MSLSRSFRNVLQKLAERPDEYHSAQTLPNGHGHTHPRGATGTTLSDMKSFGLIEYGKNPTHSLYGWKITEHGRSVLASEEDR